MMPPLVELDSLGAPRVLLSGAGAGGAFDSLLAIAWLRLAPPVAAPAGSPGERVRVLPPIRVAGTGPLARPRTPE